MSATGLIYLKAIDNGFLVLQQDWTVTGGASSPEDAMDLLGTPGGSLTSFGANEIEEFGFENASIFGPTNIPDNYTAITNVRFITSGGTALANICPRFGGITDITQNMSAGFIDYPNSVPFGGSGAWLRSSFSDLATWGFESIGGAGGVLSDWYLEVTFTIPDPVTPVIVDVSGGTVCTFEASSGNFITSDYQFHWADFPATDVAITIVDGKECTSISPVRSAGLIGLSVYDAGALPFGGTRPYDTPAFLGIILTALSIGMEFLEDPSGTPSDYAVTGGVTMGSSYMGYLSKDISGIYTLTANKRNDTVYVRAGSTLTQDVQIPNPFAELGFTECDDE